VQFNEETSHLVENRGSNRILERRGHPERSAMSTGLAEDAAELGKQLRRRRWRLMTVESCTAGSLAALLAGCDRASDFLHGGLVVYTKEAKRELADVPKWLLADRTAVNREVALAMAHGGLAKSSAEVAVSITGCAGPAPDEDGNPVGLVHIAAVHRSGMAIHEELHLGERTKGEIYSACLITAIRLVRGLLDADPASLPPSS
jgi:nicotinamide-nucleotide amidase